MSMAHNWNPSLVHNPLDCNEKTHYHNHSFGVLGPDVWYIWIMYKWWSISILKMKLWLFPKPLHKVNRLDKPTHQNHFKFYFKRSIYSCNTIDLEVPTSFCVGSSYHRWTPDPETHLQKSLWTTNSILLSQGWYTTCTTHLSVSLTCAFGSPLANPGHWHAQQLRISLATVACQMVASWIDNWTGWHIMGWLVLIVIYLK